MPILSIVVGAGSSQKKSKAPNQDEGKLYVVFSKVERVSRPWKIPHPLSTAIKQGCQKTEGSLAASAFATLKATAIHQRYIKAVPKGEEEVQKTSRASFWKMYSLKEEGIISLAKYRRRM